MAAWLVMGGVALSSIMIHLHRGVFDAAASTAFAMPAPVVEEMTCSTTTLPRAPQTYIVLNRSKR